MYNEVEWRRNVLRSRDSPDDGHCIYEGWPLLYPTIISYVMMMMMIWYMTYDDDCVAQGRGFTFNIFDKNFYKRCCQWDRLRSIRESGIISAFAAVRHLKWHIRVTWDYLWRHIVLLCSCRPPTTLRYVSQELRRTLVQICVPTTQTRLARALFYFAKSEHSTT